MSLVERLRNLSQSGHISGPHPIFDEAADEIERLSPANEDVLASGRIAAWLRDFGMEHNNPEWTDDLKRTLRLAGVDLSQWGIELKE